MLESNLKSVPLLFRGKVRDVYDLGENLLIVATDRISAFDVVLPDPIPHKGAVLTQLTHFWLRQFADTIPNHSTNLSVSDVLPAHEVTRDLELRSMIVKKAESLPIECVARGYLLGSGYKDYIQTGEVCGVKLPDGLKMAQKLPEVIFTPSTKAARGDHDENITFDQAAKLVGIDVARSVRQASIDLYSRASLYAEKHGIIIADTKFEFGMLDGKLTLIDEVLTPDSSRYWGMSDYKVDSSPSSYDKQIVRDYLETVQWNKKPPAPSLPPDIIAKTSARYLAIYKILTGHDLSVA